MKRRLLLLLLVLVGLGSYFAGRNTTQTVSAQTQHGRCLVAVPREWGEFRPGGQGYAFEDQSGTIRVLTQLPCGGLGGTPQVGVEIRRQ